MAENIKNYFAFALSIFQCSAQGPDKQTDFSFKFHKQLALCFTFFSFSFVVV